MSLSFSRRRLLQLGLASTLNGIIGPFLAATGTIQSRMEYTSIFLYPWDIADEGVDRVLQNVKEKIGVKSITLAVTYHAGKFLLPHNPKRKVYFPEDGALYFQPNVTAFSSGKIRPRIASLVSQKDFLAAIIQKARQHGLKVTAWMVCLHNTYLGTAYPQYTAQNAYGDRYYFSLCPSQEEVQTYLSRVLTELVREHALDAVELETPGFMGFTHGFHHEIQGIKIDKGAELLLSLCFCEACKSRASRKRINAEQVQTNVRSVLDHFFTGGTEATKNELEVADRVPGLKDYLLLRNETVTGLVSRLQAICEANSTRLIFVTLPDVISWTAGTDLRSIGEIVSAVEIACYTKSKDEIARSVSEVKSALPQKTRLYAAFRPSFPDNDNAGELHGKVAECRDRGVTGCSFYNYGLIRESEYAWMKQAIAERQHV